VHPSVDGVGQDLHRLLFKSILMVTL